MTQSQFDMITTKKYLLLQFEDNIQQEGLFWRIARPDTFIDLLRLQAGKSSKKGLDDKLAVAVILIAVKALVNGRLGIKKYTADYKRLNKELFEEQDTIRLQVDQILSNSLLKSEDIPQSSPLSDDLDYFSVLNDLEIGHDSLEVFEHILSTFLSYIRTKHP